MNTELDMSKVEEFALKVATDAATAKAGVLTYIGDRLGIWAAMADSGPITSEQLASLTGYNERYLQDWLATQASIGYLTYDAANRRFTLPAEHAPVLADEDSPAFGHGAVAINLALYAAADRVADAFRTGDGIAWGDHHPILYTAVDRFFRPLYERSLVSEWLPALDGIVERLERGARVLDVGCGYGTSAILMAQAFPQSQFHGVDVHAESILAAREAAARAGVEDRVTFAVGDATSVTGQPYDLVCFFDAFHHLGDPTAAARQVRSVLAGDGTLMLVEPLAADRVEDNLHLIGTAYYGASVLLCLPDAKAQGADDALGGQAGAARLSTVLHEAGFGQVRVAAKADFNIVVEARL
jgi:SAM-dependent methyltransferase